MRLYLSSFRLGDHVDQLHRLAPPPGPTIMITAALDGQPAPQRHRRAAEERERLEAAGYSVADLDLRADVTARTLRDTLRTAALVWVRGGNVFTLRHQLAQAGLDGVLLDGLRRDEFCYGGYSAGACVLGPSLQGLESCDDPSEAARAFGAVARTDGLGILDRIVVPHLDTPEHPESGVLQRVADSLAAAGVPHLGLRDGDVWLVDGDPADGRLLARRAERETDECGLRR